MSLYTHHFRITNEYGEKQGRFHEGSQFNEVVALYVFGRELRYRVFSGIEKIEVALRARMGYHLGGYGPNSYRNPNHFRSLRKHTEILRTF